MTKNKYSVYTVNFDKARLLLATDIHNCQFDWYDMKTEDRMELFTKSLIDEYERKPYDAIVTLGDYSLDFWAWNEGGSYLWETPVSRTDEFIKKYVSRMPTDFYMIPGNHEQYGNEIWQKIVGTPREYVIEYGEYVFVMLDTFAGELDPKRHHDGIYTGINTEFLSSVLCDYKDKKVILCAHDISIAEESDAARNLILENKNVICAFTGHTHRDNASILPISWRSLPVFYCGDFSSSSKESGERNWGYRLLDVSSDAILTEYVRIK